MPRGCRRSLQLVRLLLLIQDRDAPLAGMKADDARLEKLDAARAQDLWKRALRDVLIGGKLMEPGAYHEGVRLVDQGDLDRGVFHFTGEAQGKE